MRSFNNHKAVYLVFVLIWLVGCGQKATHVSFQRVAVTGASVTAGWGRKTPPIKGDFGAYQVTMQHVMEGMIEDPHQKVGYFGDMFFFNYPKKIGTKLIDQLIEYNPTFVVAIDFMFWFGYDSAIFTDDLVAHKLSMFEYGLTQLDRIEVPMIVGDIPDMRAAIGGMLSSSQVPDATTIAIMNKRLRLWAMDHPNVTIVNLHDLVENLMSDEQINVYDSMWPAGSQAKLLQKDMLHPTLEGTIVMCLLIPEAIGETGLQTDPAIIMKRAAAFAREN